MKILFRMMLVCNFLLFNNVQAGEGALALTTEPNEADILVDGELKANTTPIVLKLPAGKHRIEIRKEGKQPESLEILIADEAVLSKQVTLVDLPKTDGSLAENKFLEVLEPKHQPLETDQEFLQRRQQSLDEFNKNSDLHLSNYQAGTVQLVADKYDIQRHTFAIGIEWQEWAKRFQQLTNSSFAATREEAKALLAEGQQKPVFLRLTYDSNQPSLHQKPIIKQVILVGTGKEWVIDPMSGHLTVVGIPALIEFMRPFVQKYQQYYPNVKIAEAPSNTPKQAFAALAEGTAHFVPMMQEAKPHEMVDFVKKYGYEPTGFKVALNILAIYVHKDNPIKAFDISQLDAIFSSTRRCGYTEDITQWEQTWVVNWVKKWTTLGLQGKFEGTIEPCNYGNNKSLDSLFFQEVALCGGQLKTDLEIITNPQQALKWVAFFTNTICFGQRTYKTDKVKIVPLVANPLETGHEGAGYFTDFIHPTVENVVSGNYPLGGFIWIYVNKVPNQSLDSLEKSFIELALSETGQNIVKEQGLTALPDDLVASEREKIHGK